jgi:acyl-CoA reductase-like NAD-dependent aldehyde dehydrogenase
MSNKVTFQNYGAQQNWVNGGIHSSTSKKTISVLSPYFDKEIATIPESNFSDLDYAVQKAKAAFP